MPTTNTEEVVDPPVTIEDRLGNLRVTIGNVAELCREVLNTLSDREVIMAIASDSGEVYEMSTAIAPMVRLGPLVESRLRNLVELSRSIDQMTDPGTISRVE